jgi:hypothetical protein
MRRVGFEPTISVLERAKTFYDLARTATAIGSDYIIWWKFEISCLKQGSLLLIIIS